MSGNFRVLNICELKNPSKRFDSTVQMFWDTWGSESNYKFYYDCMLHSMGAESDLPRFYIALQDSSIVGTYALLRNDLISRQDIFPWLSCLFVVPEYRGQNIGSRLINHAIHECRKMGFINIYLSSDLEGYYEKFGWIHLTNGYAIDGSETKIFTARTTNSTDLLGCPVIKSVLENPKYEGELITYISEAWPAIKELVISQLKLSLSTDKALPQTFFMLKDNRIIGFYQMIEQELLIRKDLSPWIAPLFIDERERGHSYGAMLLKHARRTAGQLGYDKVYLTTDHIQYYEKYGFREIGLSNFEWGRPSKIYEHDTIR